MSFEIFVLGTSGALALWMVVWFIRAWDIGDLLRDGLREMFLGRKEPEEKQFHSMSVQLPNDVVRHSLLKVKVSRPVMTITDNFGNAYVSESYPIVKKVKKFIAHNFGDGPLVVTATWDDSKPRKMIVREWR
jgi:hypothetical protein